MDFHEAHNKLHHAGHGGEMQSRKIANNTYLCRTGDDEIGLLLHYTYVARFRRDGSVILDSGGWHTKTTADRLDYVSGWRQFSVRGDWWVTFSNRWDRNQWVPFFDGIHLHQRTGEILSADEELERVMEMRRPGPTKSERMKDYLTFVLDPDSMATFGNEWKVSAGDRVVLDIDEDIKQRPHHAMQFLLNDHYFDIVVAERAIALDVATRGEFERQSEREALEWAQVMGQGKEPPRFRSTMRNFINYYLEA